MNFKRPLKHIRRFIKKSMNMIFQSSRHFKYYLLSENNRVIGSAKCFQPVLFNGEGEIRFGKNVKIGVIPSKDFYSGYCYFDCKDNKSKIIINDNVHINNNCTFICNEAGIEIGSNTLIGTNVSILDSDFHNLDPKMRLSDSGISKKVTISENVFIGSNVNILKGVSIGRNSVVAHSSVVTKSFPDNVVIGGNPAKILKYLDKEKAF